jgi:hypothetical protein
MINQNSTEPEVRQFISDFARTDEERERVTSFFDEHIAAGETPYFAQLMASIDMQMYYNVHPEIDQEFEIGTQEECCQSEGGCIKWIFNTVPSELAQHVARAFYMFVKEGMSYPEAVRMAEMAVAIAVVVGEIEINQ